MSEKKKLVFEDASEKLVFADEEQKLAFENDAEKLVFDLERQKKSYLRTENLIQHILDDSIPEDQLFEDTEGILGEKGQWYFADSVEGRQLRAIQQGKFFHFTGLQYLNLQNTEFANNTYVANSVSFWIRNQNVGRLWYGNAFIWSSQLLVYPTGTANPNTTWNSGLDLSDGNWYFMTVVASGSYLRFYINGNLESDTAGSYNFGNWQRLFNGENAVNNPMGGDIWGIGMWSNTWDLETHQEAYADYLTFVKNNLSTLSAYWNGDDTAGIIAQDATAKPNNINNALIELGGTPEATFHGKTSDPAVQSQQNKVGFFGPPTQKGELWNGQSPRATDWNTSTDSPNKVEIWCVWDEVNIQGSLIRNQTSGTANSSSRWLRFQKSGNDVIINDYLGALGMGDVNLGEASYLLIHIVLDYQNSIWQVNQQSGVLSPFQLSAENVLMNIGGYDTLFIQYWTGYIFSCKIDGVEYAVQDNYSLNIPIDLSNQALDTDIYGNAVPPEYQGQCRYDMQVKDSSVLKFDGIQSLDFGNQVNLEVDHETDIMAVWDANSFGRRFLQYQEGPGGKGGYQLFSLSPQNQIRMIYAFSVGGVFSGTATVSLINILPQIGDVIRIIVRWYNNGGRFDSIIYVNGKLESSIIGSSAQGDRLWWPNEDGTIGTSALGNRSPGYDQDFDGQIFYWKVWGLNFNGDTKISKLMKITSIEETGLAVFNSGANRVSGSDGEWKLNGAPENNQWGKNKFQKPSALIEGFSVGIEGLVPADPANPGYDVLGDPLTNPAVLNTLPDDIGNTYDRNYAGAPEVTGAGVPQNEDISYGTWVSDISRLYRLLNGLVSDLLLYSDFIEAIAGSVGSFNKNIYATIPYNAAYYSSQTFGCNLMFVYRPSGLTIATIAQLGNNEFTIRIANEGGSTGGRLIVSRVSAGFRDLQLTLLSNNIYLLYLKYRGLGATILDYKFINITTGQILFDTSQGVVSRTLVDDGIGWFVGTRIALDNKFEGEIFHFDWFTNDVSGGNISHLFETYFSEEKGLKWWDLSSSKLPNNNANISMNGTPEGNQFLQKANKYYQHNFLYGYHDNGESLVPGDPDKFGYAIDGNKIDNLKQVEDFQQINRFLDRINF